MLRKTICALAGLALMLFAAGCSQFASVGDALRGASPREQYAAVLERAGLAETPMGRAWVAAGAAALDSAVVVSLPHAETGFFNPAQPFAVAFRFAVREGQELRVHVDPPDSTRLFVDLFEVRGDSVQTYHALESADDSLEITREVDDDATYALRLQPELLRGGRYRVTIETGASVGFPVSGYSSGSIRSFFGDARDGGRRDHHGVDIFAPHGTPVVAVRDGIVTRVNETNLGGKVVWLRSGGRSYYYAHLDTQLVHAGRRVSTGDTLGRVGNTGNARTTPPHLHFGIYARGPRDPFPFVHEPQQRPPRVTADTARLGRLVRVDGARASVQASPERGAAVRRAVPRDAVATVVGASGSFYAIVLPDGTRGYVAARSVEDVSERLRPLILSEGQHLAAAPRPDAPAVDSLKPGTQVAVRGGWNDYVLVGTEAGRMGWLRR